MKFCTNAKNGKEICITVFSKIIQNMAKQSLEQYEEVMEDQNRNDILKCIDEKRYADIDKLEFFYPMIIEDHFDFFAEKDAVGKYD